jgi:hypothetical protein
MIKVMNRQIYNSFLLMIASSVLYAGGEAAVNKGESAATYFPLNEKIILVYESSFGETSSTYTGDESALVISNEGGKFKYRQTLIVKDDGVYVKDTYQYFKIFLFLKKENSITYPKPLLRFPLPLETGREWKCESMEYCDGDSNKIAISGKVIGRETIVTKAGSFSAFRIESNLVNETGMKNKLTEWYAEGIGLIKVNILIEGGGISGLLRDLLGYGEINFELKEIKKSI